MSRMAIDDPNRVLRQKQVRHIMAGAKVGATSGWVVNAATDVWRMATIPASQTGSTLVVPIPFAKRGWGVSAFWLIGQIESGGNAVTVDAQIKRVTAAAADITVSSSLGSMTQLSVTADTIMSEANTKKVLTNLELIGSTEVLFALITATTLGSTDIDLMALAVEFTER